MELFTTFSPRRETNPPFSDFTVTSFQNISALMISPKLHFYSSQLQGSQNSNVNIELYTTPTPQLPYEDDGGTFDEDLNTWESDVMSRNLLPLDSEKFFNLSLNKDENESLPELPIDMQFNDAHRLAIVFYSILMAISAIGNISVFSAIVRLRIKGRLSRINLFLLHLAIADLLVTFLTVPLEISWNITVSWQAGDLMCRIMMFFRIFGLYLSGFVVICISMDRYFAVLKPLAIPDANSRGRTMLAASWIASFLCSLPQSLIFHVEHHPNFTWYEQCITFNSFPSPEYEQAYNFFVTFFLYVLPLIMIVFCYSRILYEICRINALKKNEEELRRSNMGALGRAKTRTLKMSVIIVATFFFCWTPYNIMSLWYWFDRKSAAEVDLRVQKALFWFACTNSGVNPLIYGLFHFRTRGKSNSTIVQRSLPNGYHHRLNQSQPYRMRVRWKPSECCIMGCGSSANSDRTPAVSACRRGNNHVHVRPTQQFWVGDSPLEQTKCDQGISENLPMKQDITVTNGNVVISTKARCCANGFNHNGHRRCSNFQMAELQTRLGTLKGGEPVTQTYCVRNHIIEGSKRNRMNYSSVL